MVNTCHLSYVFLSVRIYRPLYYFYCLLFLPMEKEKRKEENKFLTDELSENAVRKMRVGGFIIITIFFIAAYFLFELKIFDFISEYRPLVKRVSLTLFFIFLLLSISRIAQNLIISHSHSNGYSYNLVRITRLIANLFIALVVLSFLFKNWYTAAVSFGLISLILGFALQVPISSFIAWLYIVFRNPFRLGDRIEIKGFKGDVVQIGYIDTTLLEFSGNYLSNDRLSGRVIRFPNSLVLSNEVYNYSGPQAPFIWNETAIQIAYSSDLKFVEEALFAAAKADFDAQYAYLKIKSTAMWNPAIYFRLNTYAWVEAVVSYPVLPKETTPRRTRIIKQALEILNAQPDKVQFPEGTSR